MKIVEDKKGESNQDNKKALDLLLKPANPTPYKFTHTPMYFFSKYKYIRMHLYFILVTSCESRFRFCADHN